MSASGADMRISQAISCWINFLQEFQTHAIILQRLFRQVCLRVAGGCPNRAFTGWRYIVFFSGGSGFVVPVPEVVILLFLCGVALVMAPAMAIWFPRFAAVAAMTALFTLAATTIIQTILQDVPSADVLLRRSGFIALYTAVAIMLYLSRLRKGQLKDA